MSGWLLDTQLLVWSGYAPQRLPVSLARELIDRQRDVRYSVVSLWEVAIKASLKRADFQVSPMDLRQGLLAAGFAELPIQADHVLAVEHLPLIHRDPFDRLLVVQAAREGLRLLTSDRTLASYGDPVQWLAG
jgi:PIN domain nuclease of toxin-antitoxin system